MKKNLFSLSIISAALLVSTSTNATLPIDPQQLIVAGTIPSGTCAVTVSNSDYDIGTIPIKRVKENTRVWLGAAQIEKMWTVNCSSHTTMSLKIEDNRAETSTDAELFGLGSVNTDGKIGGYQITLYEAAVNDTLSDLLSDRTNKASKVIKMAPNDTVKWVDDNGKQQSATGNKFQAKISLLVQLGSQEDMKGPIAAETELDGSAKLTFTYGI